MKRLTCFSVILIIVFSVVLSGCSNNEDSIFDKEYSLTIIQGNFGGNGTVDPDYGSHTYKSREHVIVTATPQPGSLFSGWQGINGILTKQSAVDPSRDSSYLDNKIEIVMDGDHTITAGFWQACTLTLEIKGPGAIIVQKVEGLGGTDALGFTGQITQNPCTLTYFRDEYVTFSVVEPAGTVFTGWTSSESVYQIDPQRLPINTNVPFTGSMTVPLSPKSRDVTLYLQHDVKLTANFSSSSK